MSFPKLKPCPFCGGEVTLEPALGTEKLWLFRCDEASPCMGTGFGQYAQADKLENAISIWNTRAANSDGGVEPVAWRYRATYGDGSPVDGWQFSEEPSLLGLYQPLYAHPPAKALDGIAVKALNWSADENVKMPIYTATSLLGFYVIRTGGAILDGKFDLEKNGLTVKKGGFETLEKAKAAAQADFDQRIRSALSTPSPM